MRSYHNAHSLQCGCPAFVMPRHPRPDRSRQRHPRGGPRTAGRRTHWSVRRPVRVLPSTSSSWMRSAANTCERMASTIWHQRRRRGADPIGKRERSSSIHSRAGAGLSPPLKERAGCVETQNAKWQCCNQKHGVWPAVGCHTCHRPCWRPHDGSRAHERNNTFIDSHLRRPPGRACLAVYLRDGWRQSCCSVSLEMELSA